MVVSAGEMPAEAQDRKRPWYADLRRCGQVNFNEADPLTLDVNAWMDYWVSLKVNAVVVGGGGIVASYPTNVPYHHRSEFLGSRDLTGEAIEAARKRNLRVIARMDCNYAYQDALQAHPEWFQRLSDGSPRLELEAPYLFKTCMFSTYFTEQMPAIYREINQRYAPDAFFTNGWPGTAALEVCHCLSCQKIYREQTGGVPPAATDTRSPIYRKYYEVYMDRIVEIWKMWDGIAKEKNPDSVYFGDLGGAGLQMMKDVKRIGDIAAWYAADHQGRSGNTPIWECAAQGRIAQSVMQGRTVSNIDAAYSDSQPKWRHSSMPAAELNLWMAQATACGMVPWHHWLGGSPQDNRWREPAKAFYDWLAANESHFRNQRSLADIAVLYPQSTIAFYRSDGTKERRLNGDIIDPEEYLQGLYYALLEGHFLFDFVHQENLSAKTLRPYRALLIPNAAFLRDSECEAIRQYVAAGGSVLATFETSRYNEWGDPRGDFGLHDLFAVSVAGDFTGHLIGPSINSYMHIDQEHPVLKDFSNTSILPGPEFRVPVTFNTKSPLHLSVVPQYPSAMPELAYPRVRNTQEPAAVFREIGASRVVYFPGDIDRTAWRSGNPDFTRLLGNSVRWLLGNRAAPLSVQGKGMMELFAWETEPGMAIHIVNYTNPNMTRPFVRELYPIGPLQIRVGIPKGKNISKVRALRSGRNLLFTREADVMQFEVSSVEDYEVIALT
jgi:hypothetical protein